MATSRIEPHEFLQDKPEKQNPYTWATDLFVSNDDLTLIIEDEGIEGTTEFEEKTGMSREVLWHIKNGKSRWMPMDKADWILTKTGNVNRFVDLDVYTREKDGEGNYRYTRAQ